MPGISGVITVIENYRKELERQGHQVYIFAPEYPNHQEKNPRVFRFKSVDTRSKIAYPLPIIFSPRIGNIVKKLKLDIIHTQQFFVCGQLAWYYAKKFNIPLISSHHTRYELYADIYLSIFALPKEISRPLARLLCAFFADTCDLVIVPTKDVKKLLLKDKVKKPIEVLPSGIELEKFHNKNPQLLRKKYNVNKDDILLMTASRLCPEKNIYFLLKTFKQIASYHSNVRFMIVGEGISKKLLENQSNRLDIKHKIIFTGEVPYEKMPDYYSIADIFVFSSLTETQGLIIIEAMATGLPVVAINANGVKDMIVNGNNGFLTPNNTSEFAKKVSQIIKDSNLRKKMSKNAIETAERYSIEETVKKLIMIYENAVKKKNQEKKKTKFSQKKLNQFLNKEISLPIGKNRNTLCEPWFIDKGL